jgi:dTDP-4-dehydrorhamnose reductase
VTKILLLGKTGQVGHELLQTLAPLGTLLAPSRGELDLTRTESLRTTILNSRPDVIVNAAGFTNVDAAQAQPELAMQLNTMAPAIIAQAAKQVGALLIHYSTTFVFDGTKREPYTEDDLPNPINAYGRSKLAAEQAIRATGCDHIILRELDLQQPQNQFCVEDAGARAFGAAHPCGRRSDWSTDLGTRLCDGHRRPAREPDTAARTQRGL